MFKLDVKASRSYSVFIKNDSLNDIVSYIKGFFKGKRIVIISDTNVFPLYGNIVKEQLSEDYDVHDYVFIAGERSKNPGTLIDILEFCAKKKLSKNDLMIALGGGVVGDITGLSASLYLRGIPYIQIPTTLLAQVDSSVGGKTAVDLAAGKNLMGTFYQPSMVIIDPKTLDSLPEEIFKDGCAEVIKYSILEGGELFDLVKKGIKKELEEIIYRCLCIKNKYVTEDEFDKGERKKLNLGHTLGHSIEKLSDYSVSHGKAVAAGLCLISRAAYKNKICDKATCDSIINMFKFYDLPTSFEYTPDDLFKYTVNDKKIEGNELSIILPVRIGDCIIKKIDIDDFKRFIM